MNQKGNVQKSSLGPFLGAFFFRCQLSTFAQATPQSNSLMEVLLQKIRAIGFVNNEIIERVNARKAETVPSLEAVIGLQEDGKHFELKEAKDKSVNAIVDVWTWEQQLVPVEDIFNHKLDCKCTNFDDLSRLNKQIMAVVETFAKYGNSQTTLPELDKWKQNLEILQIGLGQVEASLLFANPGPSMKTLLKRLTHLNSAMDIMLNTPQVSIAPIHQRIFIFGKPRKQYPGFRLATHEELTTDTQFVTDLYSQYFRQGGLPTRVEWACGRPVTTSTNSLVHRLSKRHFSLSNSFKTKDFHSKIFAISHTGTSISTSLQDFQFSIGDPWKKTEQKPKCVAIFVSCPCGTCNQQ